jgi:hypothetical protein
MWHRYFFKKDRFASVEKKIGGIASALGNGSIVTENNGFR